uniref:Uncharacterized protein n=1 Tax=Oryza sativa subsp. japonica TaxID=39947 RepID=Q67WF9_ORYSJ|nr:hypothetical protein [Oryza sativa Japonica Group]
MRLPFLIVVVVGPIALVVGWSLGLVLLVPWRRSHRLRRAPGVTAVPLPPTSPELIGRGTLLPGVDESRQGSVLPGVDLPLGYGILTPHYRRCNHKSPMKLSLKFCHVFIRRALPCAWVEDDNASSSLDGLRDDRLSSKSAAGLPCLSSKLAAQALDIVGDDDDHGWEEKKVFACGPNLSFQADGHSACKQTHATIDDFRRRTTFSKAPPQASAPSSRRRRGRIVVVIVVVMAAVVVVASVERREEGVDGKEGSRRQGGESAAKLCSVVKVVVVVEEGAGGGGGEEGADGEEGSWW